ncbi:MAG: copper amine oxidase N-terminal domain-containing protein, partial [Firmicutes bacterium]|nr:copper amine oxidase N-terminal domain-containing protein [Bacillota bacterium]
MKRKIFTAMLTLALTAGICGSVYAADSYISLQIGSKTMTVGGEERTLDAVPVIIDNRTFVPVRAVVEALGGTAGWDAETKTVLLDKNDIHIELTIGSKTALLNKGEEEMDTAPVIIDGRTMLPLRFIAENFGFETAWDAETKTIGISQTNEIYESDEINYNYDIVHYGSDGNLYISADNSFKVLDENGGLIDEYEDMDKMSFRLTDEDGKAYVFYYDADEAYITAPDGTKTTLADNDDFELADKDGNTYSFVFARPDNKICSCLIVKDKNGDIIKRYYDKGEMRSYYKDKNGRDVIGIVSKDGGPDNGIILADGKYVQFSREYTSTYVDDNDNFYGEINGWFCPLKKAGGASDEAQMTDFYDIYTDKHGNEYKCINIDESPVI